MPSQAPGNGSTRQCSPGRRLPILPVHPAATQRAGHEWYLLVLDALGLHLLDESGPEVLGEGVALHPGVLLVVQQAVQQHAGGKHIDSLAVVLLSQADLWGHVWTFDWEGRHGFQAGGREGMACRQGGGKE